MTTGREITNYDEAFARDAARYAQQEKASGGRHLSTRAGVLSFDDQPLPGNQVLAIVLDSVMENTYYATRFDANNPGTPPTCYAFGRGDTPMFPYLEDMRKAPHYFTPQHIVNGEIKGCDGCPRAEWGSNDRGTGKACSNRYRLALLVAGEYEQAPNRRDWEAGMYEDPDYYRSAEPLFLKLPVTSGKNWSNYMRMLRTTHGRPPYGAVTRIYLQPDPKTQFSVNFSMEALLPDELAPIIIPRHHDMESAIIQGYQPPQEPPAGGPGRFKSFKR